ncbi:hypothetical protein ARHIZOSPH14_27760 [Agromyces rhizosphaerae]|uniref:Uncharacterized protein n=1 Tax=Agromyces rhizosphaerae TaxID=88374 RepID=A0A9W6CXE3_9MICO|nr:hypothetical protein [Agromyces rhizosphaerae]GLI28534.1 hypothetical protein ARHIZOSPH14_27760 [Agromyces rhizosphaerae]
MLRTAAWTAPAIVVAGAVPTAAASVSLWQLTLRLAAGRQPTTEVDTLRVAVGLDPSFGDNQHYGQLVSVTFSLHGDYYTGEWTGQNITPTSGGGGLEHTVQIGPLGAPGSSLEMELYPVVLPDHVGATLPDGVVRLLASGPSAGEAQLDV